MSKPFSATIVVPLKVQQDDWLHQAMTSALTQSVPTAVLVVTSEATPDSNLGVLNQLDTEFSNLAVLRPPPLAGFADAINLGFRMAETDRVGLLLSDDWLSPDTVEKCLVHDADIVSTGRTAYSADGSTVLWSRIPDLGRYERFSGLEEKASYLGHFLFFRRTPVLAVGGVDPDIGLTGADDYDLIWTLLEMNASVALVSEALYHYRDHDLTRLTLRSQPHRTSHHFPFVWTSCTHHTKRQSRNQLWPRLCVRTTNRLKHRKIYP